MTRHHTADEHVALCLLCKDALNDESDQADTSFMFSDAHTEKLRSEASSQTADELDDCQPGNAFKPHEQVLLGFTQHSFTTKAVFEESQYLLCPQFGYVYRALRYSDSNERKAAVRKATALQKERCSLPPLDKKRCRSASGANINSYHLANGILYYDHPYFGEVVCVPNGYSSVSVGERPAGQTTSCSGTADQSDDDDGSDSDAQDTVCSAATHDDRLTLRELFIKEMHNTPLAMHRGIGATYSMLNKRYFWPFMREDVTTWINGCSTCVAAKIQRKRDQGKMQRVQRPIMPGKSFNFDFMVDLPKVVLHGIEYSKLAVAVDRFSTRAFLGAMPTNCTAVMLANWFVDELVLKNGFGVISEVISDRDTLLTSKFFTALSDRLGTTMSMATSRTQWTNGGAERAIAVIEEMMRTSVSWSQLNWVELLPHIIFAYGSAPKPALGGHSAFYFERGVEPTLPVDLIKIGIGKNAGDAQSGDSTQKVLASDWLSRIVDIRTRLCSELTKITSREKKAQDSLRREADKIVPGKTKCWLSLEGINIATLKVKDSNRKRKLNPLWYGPFDVVKRTGRHTFELNIPDDKVNAGLHRSFHVTNLRVYEPNHMDFDWSATLPDMEQQQIQYEVDDILSHRRIGKRNEFLVSWVGHSATLSSEFVTEAELRRNASEVLERYMTKHNIKSDGTVIDDDSSDDEPDASKPPAARVQPASKRRKVSKPAAPTKGQSTNQPTSKRANSSARDARAERRAKRAKAR